MLLKAISWTEGWPKAIAVHPDIRVMKRHGSRCEIKNRRQAVTKSMRNTVEDKGSLEKFVIGVIVASMES